ncbi:YpjP family protein [Scopulibacillus cellulosilyticus]|uniref:YpjP family protein n=1 Tax=Scopulibacillus cellulosilyticus TaxID=2665665 RepID=A0ABW2PYE8_9BACL
MPLWFRKTLVVLVAILTLGTVVPTSYLHTENKPTGEKIHEESNEASVPELSSKEINDIEKPAEEKSEALSWQDIVMDCQTKEEITKALESFATEEAVNKGMKKFGPVIGKQIGDTYQNDIAPKFGHAVASMVEKNKNENLLRHLEVSNDPAGGTGERILHFYDSRNGKEWIKFHVRRDHPPKEGYWFNFHYHTNEDNFQVHHELGKIYWDKNTPPHWQV